MSTRGHELSELHDGLRVAQYRSLLWRWLRGAKGPASQVPAAFEVRPGEVGVRFGGHASLVVKYAGFSIVCDPVVRRRLGVVRRANRPGLSDEDLRTADLVLISHGHHDHFDPKALRRVSRTATVIVPSGLAHRLSQFGFARVVELAAGVDLLLGEVTIAALPTSHGETDGARGNAYHIVGHGPSVYYCADSGYFSGFAEVGRLTPPDLVALPIGGFWPRGLRDRHMSPLDALVAFEDLRARLMIPIHYGTFPLSYEKLDEPLRLLQERARACGVQDRLVILRPGQVEHFVRP